MPLYEYYCPPCENKFELLRPMSRSTDDAVCATCGGESHRALSVFAAISGGSGFGDDAMCYDGGGGYGCGAGGACACAGE